MTFSDAGFLGVLRVKIYMSILLGVDVSKSCWNGKLLDHDQILHNGTSDLGLHYMLLPCADSVGEQADAGIHPLPLG